MDHKPLTPSSLGLRALGKGSSDGKPATDYKAPEGIERAITVRCEVISPICKVALFLFRE